MCTLVLNTFFKFGNTASDSILACYIYYATAQHTVCTSSGFTYRKSTGIGLTIVHTTTVTAHLSNNLNKVTKALISYWDHFRETTSRRAICYLFKNHDNFLALWWFWALMEVKLLCTYWRWDIFYVYVNAKDDWF